LAAKKFPDNIPLAIKKRRLQEIIDKQKEHSTVRNKRDLNKIHKVLVEGYSKRSKDHLQGRNDANKVVIFPKENFQPGQYVEIKVFDCTSATLFGKAVKKV